MESIQLTLDFSDMEQAHGKLDGDEIETDEVSKISLDSEDEQPTIHS